ncbi:hypothetical protein BDB01DRAFT_734042, partial [Pilobolus umbonatus]
MNTNNNISLTPLRIGSINCRGLIKTQKTNMRNAFIRYLRSQPLDIVCIQESHAHTPELQSILNN